MSDELVTWLRAEIEARRDAAVAACEGSDGHWWRRPDDETGEPVGQLWDGAQILDSDGDVVGGRYVVVYDEGHPSDAQFEHIAANDPRDTIARCEAELAILDLYESQAAKEFDNAMEEDRTWTLAPVVRLLGCGYRFRDGYREEWAP